MSDWKRIEKDGWPRLEFERKGRFRTDSVIADTWSEASKHELEITIEDNLDRSAPMVEVFLPLEVVAEILRFRGWKVEPPR